MDRAKKNSCADGGISILRGGDRDLQSVFLDYRAVLKLIDVVVTKCSLWRWERAGQFTKRVLLNGKTVAWPCEEVVAWAEARNADR